MHPKLQEKIIALKQQEQNDKEKKRQEEIKVAKIKQKQINAKIPEAKVWVESALLDLIAKEDILIEKRNKNKTGWPGDKHLPKELYLSDVSMIPPSIPVESVVEAIKDFEGLGVRSSWTAEYNDIDGPYYPAHWSYYVTW